MGEVEAERNVAIGCSVELVVEFIGGELGAVDVFVEEPIHFVIAVEIHLLGHVFFDDGFEVFRGGGPTAIGVDEILHHGFELGIAGVIVVHHHAEHVEDVGALGINEAAGDFVAGAGIIGAITHGERADVDGAETLSIFFEEEFAFIVPEADELLLILFDQGNIERGGHLRETFAHPLITAGAEADGVTPPLVGDFVGSNDFPVAAISPIESEFVADGVVKVIADGNPDETGPGLPEIAGGLLGDVDLGELRRAEVIGVKLDGEFGFGEGFFVETGGAHVAESDGSVALAGQIAGNTLLEGLNPGRRIFVGERLDEHRRLGELCFFHFEAAEAETCDGLRILTFPDGDILIAVIGITNERAGGGEFQTFGNAER